jgi:hypothetical protein
MNTLDEPGPLDFLIFELPAGTRSYPSTVVREITRLSESEFIRVIQFAIVSKGRDGALIIEDTGDATGADTRTSRLDERMLAEGLGQAAAGLPPGRVMGVLVYESLWANPLASAVRSSGGDWVGRIRL